MNGTGRMHWAVERQTKMRRVMKSLGRIHAARAVEAAKETALKIGGPRSWVEWVQPPRRLELEFE